ncbi:fumarylacetoacetase [Rhodococcus spelaei]|uniref:fumarylacetoacetase n=1 Tax=Rhodococcus spelaei TaxID=2546320 RepID=A0A541BAU0_9NOCA|nr:fumarylacetoacetase [Rhodococcus spelaei]TQF69450.1 fumarylacetoacetase [Rhodococcus spelaei]
MTAAQAGPAAQFGVDNLPYGVFSAPGIGPRVGVRLGENVIDLSVLLGDEVFARPTLNAFLARGPDTWAAVRARVTELVAGSVRSDAVHAADTVVMHLPFEVADYVDFYASERHASNLGRMLRPGQPPLLPNWRHLPVAYHGRSGTVVVSGTEIVRPCGQFVPDGGGAPVFGPTRRLDLEVELGFVVGVPSAPGSRIGPDEFGEHVFGAVLVNDWSARDIQSWEGAPLGPFLGKSFATSISPWVVPLAALGAARIDLPAQDPEPLPYLRGSGQWGLDVRLTLSVNGQAVSWPQYRGMYWSPAQMLAHATVNGARARTGDLLASGTVSGPERGEYGSLIELSWNGTEPVPVGDQVRTFLEDGDEVTLTASAPGPGGTRIGFGEVRGRIGAARP